MRTLSIGKKGQDVAAWQDFLTGQGFSPGASDGFFGGNTRQATMQFQIQHGLVPADGIVGTGTRTAAVALGFVPPATAVVTGALHANDDFLDDFGGVSVFETEGGGAFYYTAGMTVDADGAYRAYKIRNKGLDFDDNGKNPAKPTGKWVGAVVVPGTNTPVVQEPNDPAPGYLVSTTSLADHTRAKSDPLRYVDAENVPYIVLPGGSLGSGRAGLGDYAIVLHTGTKKFVHAIVADSGPKNQIGEASIAVARALFGPGKDSPRGGGGADDPIVRYIVFPGSRDGRFPSSHPKKPELLQETLAHINVRASTLLATLSATLQTGLLA